eukprot:12238021-Karenia_brevis.AAC.1
MANAWSQARQQAATLLTDHVAQAEAMASASYSSSAIRRLNVQRRRARKGAQQSSPRSKDSGDGYHDDK